MADTFVVSPVVFFCVLAAGVMLMVGLLTGTWKFFQMWRSENGLAHPYVDIAHRASLLYSFACLVLAALAGFSVLSETANFYAVIFPIAYFYLAVGSYVLQGALNGPDNQLKRPHRMGPFAMPRALLGLFMGSLVAAEIGGVAVLIAGVFNNPMVSNLLMRISL